MTHKRLHNRKQPSALLLVPNCFWVEGGGGRRAPGRQQEMVLVVSSVVLTCLTTPSVVAVTQLQEEVDARSAGCPRRLSAAHWDEGSWIHCDLDSPEIDKLSQSFFFFGLCSRWKGETIVLLPHCDAPIRSTGRINVIVESVWRSKSGRCKVSQRRVDSFPVGPVHLIPYISFWLSSHQFAHFNRLLCWLCSSQPTRSQSPPTAHPARQLTKHQICNTV